MVFKMPLGGSSLTSSLGQPQGLGGVAENLNQVAQQLQQINQEVTGAIGGGNGGLGVAQPMIMPLQSGLEDGGAVDRVSQGTQEMFDGPQVATSQVQNNPAAGGSLKEAVSALPPEGQRAIAMFLKGEINVDEMVQILFQLGVSKPTLAKFLPEIQAMRAERDAANEVPLPRQNGGMVPPIGVTIANNPQLLEEEKLLLNRQSALRSSPIRQQQGGGLLDTAQSIGNLGKLFGFLEDGGEVEKDVLSGPLSDTRLQSVKQDRKVSADGSTSISTTMTFAGPLAATR